MERNVFSEEVKRREHSMSRFWEREQSVTVEANRLQWSFYRLAGKLQINRYYGYDRCQSITLDRRSITPEMSEIIKNFLELEVKKEGE